MSDAHSPPRKSSSTGLPRPDFPLRIHKGTGYWCKKVRGKVHYFGKVADDPRGVAALEEYQRVKEDLYAGREPSPNTGDLTVETLAFKFLENKEALRDHGELNPRTYRDYFDTCRNIVAVFGRTKLVTSLRPDDFGKLRAKLAKTMGHVTLRNEMGRVRSVFKFGFDEGLLAAPIRFGQSFARPKLDTVRRDKEAHREQHGEQMFDAHEIRAILAACDQPLRAMVLIGANCGFGQNDLARLPTKAVDLEGGWVDFARPKTAVRRRIPLWPETVAAIRKWLAVRPVAKDQKLAGLLFLTPRGCACVTISKRGAPKDWIGIEFGKLLVKLGLKRPRLSFYGLRRGVETVGGETGDQVAVDAVMGHVTPGMGTEYRQHISDDRLRRVVDHIRAWLFAEAPDGEQPGKPALAIAEPDQDTEPEPDQHQEPGNAEGPTLRLYAG